jgi:CyaY protein
LAATHERRQDDRRRERPCSRRHYTASASCHSTILSTVSSVPAKADSLSAAEYEARTHAVLAAIEATTDRFLEEDVIDIDAGRTGGLLELAFPNGSKIVVNTQPPLQELWLAAQSGGFHFRCIGGRWIDRDGGEFFTVLSSCASAQAGRPLRFEP